MAAVRVEFSTDMEQSLWLDGPADFHWNSTRFTAALCDDVLSVHSLQEMQRRSNSTRIASAVPKRPTLCGWVDSRELRILPPAYSAFGQHGEAWTIRFRENVLFSVRSDGSIGETLQSSHLLHPIQPAMQPAVPSEPQIHGPISASLCAEYVDIEALDGMDGLLRRPLAAAWSWSVWAEQSATWVEVFSAWDSPPTVGDGHSSAYGVISESGSSLRLYFSQTLPDASFRVQLRVINLYGQSADSDSHSVQRSTVPQAQLQVLLPVSEITTLDALRLESQTLFPECGPDFNLSTHGLEFRYTWRQRRTDAEGLPMGWETLPEDSPHLYFQPGWFSSP